MGVRSRDQLVVALLFVGRPLLDAANAEITANGSPLTVADTAFLLALKAFPSSSQQEVAFILGRDKTTLSRTVSRLAKAGFVHARIDPIDGRRKTLDLTEKALLIATPAFEAVARRLEAVASSLTPEEDVACFRLIDRLAEELLVA